MDCKNNFRIAYQNRYTWKNKFLGYKGRIEFTDETQSLSGEFSIDSNFKCEVNGIEDATVNKLISTQLWEVCIHRMHKSFDEVHGNNTFTVISSDSSEIEILVGGKHNGDKYKINNHNVSMVYRKIHGNIVNINTKSIKDTGLGYLAKIYTSQYIDPIKNNNNAPISTFEDDFIFLDTLKIWALSKRTISIKDADRENQYSFSFLNLINLD